MPESGDHTDAGSTGGRRRGRRSRHSESRESILAAARELFAERGYAGSTVRAIAERADVDAVLIAHFFGDKGGLFAAVAGLPARVPGDPLDALSPPEGAGARLASVYLTWREDPETAAPLLATARSTLVLGEAMDRLRGLLLCQVLSDAVPDQERADRTRERTAVDAVGEPPVRVLTPLTPTSTRGSPLSRARCSTTPRPRSATSSPLADGLGEHQLTLMAAAVRAAEALAPTHPHPSVGSSMTTNLAAGPLAALADRTRDAVRAALGGPASS